MVACVKDYIEPDPAELVGSVDDGDLAARILEPLRQHQDLVEILRNQHERWDGKGPRGLKGEAIPVGARVLTAANLYVELTETGEGGRAMSPADAVVSVRALAGTRLDPRVLAALEQVVPRD